MAGDFAVLRYPRHLLDPWWDLVGSEDGVTAVWWEGGLMARGVPANWLELREEPGLMFQVNLCSK